MKGTTVALPSGALLLQLYMRDAESFDWLLAAETTMEGGSLMMACESIDK